MQTTPIKRKEDIQSMKNYFLKLQEYRNYTLFVLGINTALRITDLLNLTWGTVYNFETKTYKPHIHIIEQKTGKCTSIALNENSISALMLLKKYSKPISETEYIFSSRNDRYHHISRNRAYIIIKNAANILHIDGNISCHSMRKTLGYHAWKCGIPPALIMEVYNHSNIEITKRYLSITQDEKDELYKMVNL